MKNIIGELVLESYKIKNLMLSSALMILTVFGVLLIQKNSLNMYIYVPLLIIGMLLVNMFFINHLHNTSSFMSRM